jgi:signal transduction histidine kinase
VVLGVGLPICAIAATDSLVADHNHDSRAHAATRLREARAVIGTDTAQWLSPDWRRVAVRRLQALGVQVRLTRAGTAVLVVPPRFAGDAIKRDPAQGAVSVFDRPHATAMLYANTSTIDPSTAVAVAAVVAALSAAAINFFLHRREIARPLTELQRAALGVADGELDIELPSSGAREINAVAHAFAQMAAELRAAHRRQDELEQERRLFIAAIVHDLRTPLFLLRGNLVALARGLGRSSRPPETYLAEAQAGADALERLVDDLFVYTRLEYLDEQPREEPVEVARLLEAAIAHTKPLAAEKAITVQASGPRTGCPMIADPNLITRVVQNLLENALRHTPAGGRVDVTWARADAQIMFSVSDSGPGFDPLDLPHVFEPLYRGKTLRGGSTPGAGLGLAIALQAIRAHRGTIEAFNAPHGGAVLRVGLPVADAA